MTEQRCLDAREKLRDLHRGRLSEADRSAVLEHLAACSDCRGVDEEERALTSLLEERLPRYAASESLKRRIAADLASSPAAAVTTQKNSKPSRTRFAGPALALAAAATIVVALNAARWAGSRDMIVDEALNDHLRELYAAHPIEIESGGIHQVKPWFSGRVDFAPVVAFSGDDEFPLLGGAVSYFVDRKAATFFFKRRLHDISLFVMRASGLPWPAHPVVRMGRLEATVESRQGFHVVLFRDGDLGYALVSDVDSKELLHLGEKIAGP